MEASTSVQGRNDGGAAVAGSGCGHLDAVDGLRGLAALVIVVYHLFTNSGHPELRIHSINILRPLHDGWCGVNLFLVLSGFCLFWPYACRPDRAIDLRRHMSRRVRRIVPAYYASLLIVPLAYYLMHLAGLTRSISNPFEVPGSVGDVLLHFGLLHSLWHKSIMSWNGVTWSLGLEWTWYLLFPLVVVSFRRFGAHASLLALLVVSATYRVALFRFLGPASRFGEAGVNLTLTLRHLVIGRLFEFGLGMWVASLVARKSLDARAARAAMLAVMVCLIAAHATTSVDVFLPVRDNLYGLAFAALLAAVVGGRQSVQFAALRSRLMAKIGESSYSLYLLHMPLVVGGLGMLRWVGLRGLPLFVASLLFVPVIVGVAYLSYRWIERPFLVTREPKPATGAPSVAMAVA